MTIRTIRMNFLRYFYVSFILPAVFFETALANQSLVNDSQGLLTVSVTNGTANGAPVTNDDVIVEILQHSRLLDRLEAKVSENGNALFENVPTGEHVMAIVRAKHQAMMFPGPVVPLVPAQVKFTTDVKVFDVSTDQSKLSVKSHHFLIKPHPEFLEITELLQLSNSSDMAISSAKRDSRNRPIVLEMMLPEGFKNLKSSSYFQDHALVETANGFYDTMAVPPGDYQVAFSYTLDITSSAMDIIKKITLPTSHFMAFIDSGEAQFHGLNQNEKRTIERNGVPMEYFGRGDLAPADVVAFRLIGLHAGANRRVTWVVLTVIFGLLVILAVVRSRPDKI